MADDAKGVLLIMDGNPSIKKYYHPLDKISEAILLDHWMPPTLK
jgi:hypothetical protein